MSYNPQKHHRRSIRLKGYDYTSPGAYFVTICVQDRACVLGHVVAGNVRLSAWGKIAAEKWSWLERQYPYVTQDEWVVMPNHLHGILVIEDNSDLEHDSRGDDSRLRRRDDSRIVPTTRITPTQTAPMQTKRKPLGRLIGAFKTVSTKQINLERDTPGARFWQRNYYEHIVRNRRELNAIRAYIRNNPRKWALDRDHPDKKGNRKRQAKP